MTRTDRPWPGWLLFGIFATVVATNAFDYSVLVPRPDLRYAMHRAIVDGTAPSPQRFRVLVPWTLDPIISLAARSGDAEQAFRRVYFAFHFFALVALVASVHTYARLWFTRDRALVGALVMASVLHLMLRMGEYWDFSPIPDKTWLAPWSLLEPVFVASGLVLLFRRKIGWFALVTATAALNSEASILLPLVAVLAGDQRRRDGLLATAVWLIVTFMLRLGIGGSAMPTSAFADNFAHLPQVIVNVLLFLGPAAILAIAGFRRAPVFAQRAALALIPLVIAIVWFADWWDVRLLSPAYPIIAPALLAGLGTAPRE